MLLCFNGLNYHKTLQSEVILGYLIHSQLLTLLIIKLEMIMSL
jgi:hypothetical protein